MKRTRPKTITPEVVNTKNVKVIDVDETEVQYSLRWLKKNLLPRHILLANEYIKNGWNGRKAYLKVYPNVSVETADANSPKILGNTRVKQYINYMRGNIEELCAISVQRQVQEYMKIAYSSIRHLHNSWVSLKDWDDIVREEPSVLDAIEVIETKTIQAMDSYKTPIQIEYVKIKLHSKLQALDKIDQILGYKAAHKVEVKEDVLLNLGTGNVKAIREAFGLKALNK